MIDAVLSASVIDKVESIEQLEAIDYMARQSAMSWLSCKG